MQSNKLNKVTLKDVRFDYPNVIKAKSFQGSDPAYSVVVIVKNIDSENLNKINAAIDIAKAMGVAKYGNLFLENLEVPLRDGDMEKEGKKGYGDCYYLNAKSYLKPQVVDRKIMAINDPEELYGGCYGNVSLEFKPYSFEKRFGITCSLINLQKMREGERLYERSTAAEDFEVYENDDLEDL